jgi:hypothetical protein
MTKPWYLENRLDEQRRYFDKTLSRSARKIFWYRTIALGSMVLAALCSAAVGLTELPIAPWTGVITTISAAFVAAGMNERTQAISAAAVRTINKLDEILFEQELLSLTELVERTEDALQEENMQWRETMQKSRAAAALAASATAQDDGGAVAAADPQTGARTEGGPAEEPGGGGEPTGARTEDETAEEPGIGDEPTDAPTGDGPADEPGSGDEPTDDPTKKEGD